MTGEEAYRLAMRACEGTWNEKTCKKIKEALEHTSWIPVSERLPETYGNYLVTKRGKRPDRKEWSDYIYLEVDQYVIHSKWGCSDCGVLAWMPLPKPYEPQESEGQA